MKCHVFVLRHYVGSDNVQENLHTNSKLCTDLRNEQQPGLHNSLSYTSRISIILLQELTIIILFRAVGMNVFT